MKTEWHSLENSSNLKEFLRNASDLIPTGLKEKGIVKNRKLENYTFF
ncbi:hypothetical protein ACL0VS_02720 [Chryseobacterium sp. PMSZPI]